MNDSGESASRRRRRSMQNLSGKRTGSGRDSVKYVMYAQGATCIQRGISQVPKQRHKYPVDICAFFRFKTEN